MGGGEGSGVQIALGWGWSTLELYGVDMTVVLLGVVVILR